MKSIPDRPGRACGADIESAPNPSMTSSIVDAPRIESRHATMSEVVEKALAAYHSSDAPEKLVLGVYVDNLQIVHSHAVEQEGTKVHSFLRAIERDWEVEDEGPMHDILGIEVKYNGDGSITLHQQTYIDKLVSEFLPNGAPTGIKGNVPYSQNLDKISWHATSLRMENKGVCAYPNLVKEYQRKLGCLMYVANCTRPDIAYAISMHCRNMCSPTPELLTELDWVFAYLGRNSGVGLTYTNVREEPMGYNDASFEMGKSTSGYNIMWQGATISWGSTKQASTSLSSCEAEIYALSEGAKDLVYFRKLLTGLGVPPTGPSACATDNQGARDLSYNPEHHKKSKHIARRHFYIRDMVEAMELTVPYVRTDDNVADILTKPLQSARFHALRAIMMNEPRRPDASRAK